MSLQEIRKNIDLLDSKILRTLNKRMELALMSKKFKTSVEDSGREKELLEKIRKDSTGLINADFIESIYKKIIKESKNLQSKDYSLIGFKGEHGAYGEMGASEWNNNLITVSCNEYADVFAGVQSGLYNYGIVPVENSLGGVVGEVNELLVNTDLYVAGAVEMPIYLSLLGLPGSDHREIRSVYSSSQALAQCQNFFSRNNHESVPFNGSSRAAKMLAEKQPKASAVVASKLAAEIYNLEIIKDDIDDYERNVTRYLILSKQENPDDGDKCSILFSTEHKAGTLFSVLEVFAKENINLTRIVSIPGKIGSYTFFMDFLGASKDEKTNAILNKVKKITSSFKLMGCYKEKKV